jgi:hypothetical protein
MKDLAQETRKMDVSGTQRIRTNWSGTVLKA